MPPRSRPPGVELRPVCPLIVMINGGYWETYGYNWFQQALNPRLAAAH
jgi:hypothetical protein